MLKVKTIHAFVQNSTKKFIIIKIIVIILAKMPNEKFINFSGQKYLHKSFSKLNLKYGQ